MKTEKFVINKEGITVSSSARFADTFLLRLLGLMGRKEMLEQEALIFHNAPSIHTFFMRFAFDLVFLDKNGRIIRTCPAIKPWRLVFCGNSANTIEFSPGTIKRTGLKIGDFLTISPYSS